MQIDLARDLAILVPQATGYGVYTHTLCQQQGSVGMPEHMRSDLKPKDFQRCFFKNIFINKIRYIISSGIGKEKLCSVAPEESFLFCIQKNF